MSRVIESFICRACLGVDVGVNVGLELVDRFCYLGDMLAAEGDADVVSGPQFELEGVGSGS